MPPTKPTKKPTKPEKKPKFGLFVERSLAVRVDIDPSTGSEISHIDTTLNDEEEPGVWAKAKCGQEVYICLLSELPELLQQLQLMHDKYVAG